MSDPLTLLHFQAHTSLPSAKYLNILGNITYVARHASFTFLLYLALVWLPSICQQGGKMLLYNQEAKRGSSVKPTSVSCQDGAEGGELLRNEREQTPSRICYLLWLILLSLSSSLKLPLLLLSQWRKQERKNVCFETIALKRIAGSDSYLVSKNTMVEHRWNTNYCSFSTSICYYYTTTTTALFDSSTEYAFDFIFHAHSYPLSPWTF